MYLTGLCEGNPDLDSGKFHNHCIECDDFGVCIHDYRESHCTHCGEHYFEGLSGFSCPHCGGGRGGAKKSEALGDLPAPSISCWDGVVEGVEQAFESSLEGVEPLQREMIMQMVLGRSYGNNGSGNPVDAAGLFGAMAQQFFAGENGDGSDYMYEEADDDDEDGSNSMDAVD